MGLIEKLPGVWRVLLCELLAGQRQCSGPWVHRVCTQRGHAPGGWPRSALSAHPPLQWGWHSGCSPSSGSESPRCALAKQAHCRENLQPQLWYLVCGVMVTVNSGPTGNKHGLSLSGQSPCLGARQSNHVCGQNEAAPLSMCGDVACALGPAGKMSLSRPCCGHGAGWAGSAGTPVALGCQNWLAPWVIVSRQLALGTPACWKAMRSRARRDGCHPTRMGAGSAWLCQEADDTVEWRFGERERYMRGPGSSCPPPCSGTVIFSACGPWKALTTVSVPDPHGRCCLPPV